MTHAFQWALGVSGVLAGLAAAMAANAYSSWITHHIERDNKADGKT